MPWGSRSAMYSGVAACRRSYRSPPCRQRERGDRAAAGRADVDDEVARLQSNDVCHAPHTSSDSGRLWRIGEGGRCRSCWSISRRGRWSAGAPTVWNGRSTARLGMVRDAGFDGVAMDVQADLDYATTVDAFLRAHGMSCMSETYPRYPRSARNRHRPRRRPDEHRPHQRPARTAPVHGGRVRPLLEGVRRLAEAATVRSTSRPTATS